MGPFELDGDTKKVKDADAICLCWFISMNTSLTTGTGNPRKWLDLTTKSVGDSGSNLFAYRWAKEPDLLFLRVPELKIEYWTGFSNQVRFFPSSCSGALVFFSIELKLDDISMLIAPNLSLPIINHINLCIYRSMLRFQFINKWLTSYYCNSKYAGWLSAFPTSQYVYVVASLNSIFPLYIVQQRRCDANLFDLLMYRTSHKIS